MRIQNETDIPTQLLEQLISFVQAQAPLCALARFVFCDQEPGKDYISGQTTRESEPGLLVFPGLVEIWVTDKAVARFPRIDQYVTGLPPISLNSWEEELVLTLAHEVRHVTQFYSDLGNDMDGYWLEFDAEAFGHQVLGLWRQQQTGRKAA